MPVVSLRRVGVAYDGRRALIDVDLDVHEGERVALVGPSGAGKTTLLGLCNGSTVQSSGEVEILGRSLLGATARDLRDVRRRVGTVYQQLHLVGPLRVVHNVNAGRLGSRSSLRALRSLIRPLDVDSAREALASTGIEHKLFERTDRLSGGEQQRVALARVLVQQPELILADEPISSLDPSRGEEVVDLLTDVVAGKRRTLIVSLHNFDIARRRFDRLVGLREGRILFDLPRDDVFDRHRLDLYRIST